MEAEWVNLLRTPENGEEETGKRRAASERRRERTVRVSENTPVGGGKAGVNKSKRSELQVLRSQVCVLVREKQDLSQSVEKSDELLNSTKRELEAALQVNSQAKVEMEDQRRVVHRLSADNAKLIHQVEKLWQQSPALHNTPSPRDQSHDILVKDLERLSHRTTELSQALGSTQQARSALERELVSLKRSNLELETSRSQLVDALAGSEMERLSLSQQLQESEERYKREMEQLQSHMNAALHDKTAKLEELLNLCERLQSTLTALSKEKELLECSLRQEVASNHQLAEEKAGMEKQVIQFEESLNTTRTELSQLQDRQLEEVETMKELLENEMTSLHQERESLCQQLEGASAERDTALREVEEARGNLEEKEREAERLTHDVSILQSTLTQSEKERASEQALLTSQLAESTARSQQLQEELERLTSQLKESASHLEETDREGAELCRKVVEVTKLLTSEKEDREKEVGQLREWAESLSHDLSSAHSELAETQASNAVLSQQVSELDSQVSSLNEQVSGRIELTNEMRALLDQRANQIDQLGAIIQQQREELLSASHAYFCSSDSAHFPPNTFAMTSFLSAGAKSPPPPAMLLGNQTMPPSNQNHTILRSELSNSRQSMAQLQTECEGLRTKVAKLQGSVQALSSVKEQLTRENTALLEVHRRSKDERKVLLQQLSTAQTTASSLRSKLTDLQGEREEVMSHVSHLEEAYLQREVELEEQSVVTTELCEGGEVEREYLQIELAKARLKGTQLEDDVDELRQLVERERERLQEEAERCSDDVCTLRKEATQFQERCCVAAAVSARQTNQIVDKEGRVSHLLGEVEALRARKSAIMRWMEERGGGDGEEEEERRDILEENKNLRSELDTARAQLQHCLATHTEETRSLMQRLQEEEGGGGRWRGGGGGRRERCRLEGRVERLRKKLKTQVEQSNYLRVKLGYTLKELQLYKQLKARLDQQLSQQEGEMAALHTHYHDCLNQLKRVEQVGFHGDPDATTMTTLPNPQPPCLPPPPLPDSESGRPFAPIITS